MAYDFSEEMAEFEAEYKIYIKELVQQCSKDLKEIVEKYLQETIYDEYNPFSNDRTYNLFKSIDVKVEGESIFVYFNPKTNTHINNQNVDVAEELPYYLNYGWNHKNYNGRVDYYHKRDKRKGHFMEKALKEMQKRQEYKEFKFEIVK